MPADTLGRLELVREANLADHVHSSSNQFSSSNASLLQDLSRGNASEVHSIYGHADMGLQMNNNYNGGNFNSVHSEFANCDVEHTAYDTAPALSQGHEAADIDLDPVALLETLANFEHPPAPSLPPSNDHFASLLEAAAASADVVRDGPRDIVRALRRTTRQSRAQEPPSSDPISRKRNQDIDDQLLLIGPKRPKLSHGDHESEARLAREREIWGDEEESVNDIDFERSYDHDPHAVSQARAIGVHSAAALFRKPTAASKKYTRPPMSRMFLSLELDPEEFLHLQAAAKNYMLDPEHPERKACVGSRGGADSAIIKLKLFECVKYFMDELGWGEKYWGAHSAKKEIKNRKLIWPKYSNRIISLTTPLLRRIVTNERQRLYAIESRSKDPRNKHTREKEISAYVSSQPLQIDPKLDLYHYNINEAFGASSHDKQPIDGAVAAEAATTYETVVGGNMLYHISVMSNGQRVRPRLDIAPSKYLSYSSLVQQIHDVINENEVHFGIQVLDATGLVRVGSEEQWKDVLKNINTNVWMDGDVRIVVDVAP